MRRPQLVVARLIPKTIQKGDAMAEFELVEIYRAKNMAQAMLLQSALTEAGIRAMLDNATYEGAAGGINLGWATEPRVMVEEPDQAKALEIAKQFDEEEVEGIEGTGRGEDLDTCLECGKPMPAGAQTCPACGWTYAAKEPGTVSSGDGEVNV
jgi:hypothetical protein